MAVAVVSDPAKLSLLLAVRLQHGAETYIWTRDSDSASSCVKPWLMKEPSMSFLDTLFTPNRLPTTCLATLQEFSNNRRDELYIAQLEGEQCSPNYSPQAELVFLRW